MLLQSDRVSVTILGGPEPSSVTRSAHIKRIEPGIRDRAGREAAQKLNYI